MSHVILQAGIPWQKAALDCIKEVHNFLSFKEWGYEFKVRNCLSEFMSILCMHCLHKEIFQSWEKGRQFTMGSFFVTYEFPLIILSW